MKRVFVETCGVELNPEVVVKNNLDPQLRHMVRREPVRTNVDGGDNGDNGSGRLIVETRTPWRSSVSFKITEEDVSPSSRSFLLQTLGPKEGGVE